MEKELSTHKSLLWFLGITFGYSWLLFLLPLAFGGPDTIAHQSAIVICWAAAMWGPGLAAIFSTRIVERKPLDSLNLKHLGKRRFYMWAWLTPIMLSILTGLLTWALRLGRLDMEFTAVRKALEGRQEQKRSLQPW